MRQKGIVNPFITKLLLLIYGPIGHLDRLLQLVDANRQRETPMMNPRLNQCCANKTDGNPAMNQYLESGSLPICWPSEQKRLSQRFFAIVPESATLAQQ